MQWPWLMVPIAGPIRITTVVMGLVIIAVVYVRRRNVVAAFVTVMAWASVYEIAFEATGVLLRGWPLKTLLWISLALLGWVALSISRGITPNPWLAVLCAAVWVIWIATGFHVNPSPLSDGSSTNFMNSAELFNEATKTALGLAFLVGALRAVPAQH